MFYGGDCYDSMYKHRMPYLLEKTVIEQTLIQMNTRIVLIMNMVVMRILDSKILYLLNGIINIVESTGGYE